jgi:lysophospholipase L1-like esterase
MLHLELTRLEPRALPTLLWVDIYPGGELVAYDDNAAGNVTVYHAAGSVFVRDDTTGILRSAPEANVAKVRLVGNGSGDQLRATTALPCTVYAGPGNDYVETGSGADYVDAGDGDDTVYAGSGDDQVLGGAGNDTLYGGFGADAIDGGAGTDYWRGGPGVDAAPLGCESIDRKYPPRPLDETNPATLPVSFADATWQARHAALRARALAGGVGVMFAGDSLVEYWETIGAGPWATYYGDLAAADFGVVGDATQHVLWRLDAGGELAGTPAAPAVVELHVGSNNLAGGLTVAQTVEGVTALCELVRELRPAAKVQLQGIFPRGAAGSALRLAIDATNAALAALDNGAWLRVQNLNPLFVAGDGSLPYQADGIHVNAAGYDVWGSNNRPLVQAMLA